MHAFGQMLVSDGAIAVKYRKCRKWFQLQKTCENLTLDEVEKQLELLKLEGSVFAKEREINERNMMDNWNRLSAIQSRIRDISRAVMHVRGARHADTLRHVAKVQATLSQVQ